MLDDCLGDGKTHRERKVLSWERNVCKELDDKIPGVNSGNKFQNRGPMIEKAIL